MRIHAATILFLLVPTLVSLRAETIIGVTNDNRLRHFDSETPGTFIKTVSITGIPTDQAIIGIDSSTNGTLTVVTRRENLVRVYQVNQAECLGPPRASAWTLARTNLMTT